MTDRKPLPATNHTPRTESDEPAWTDMDLEAFHDGELDADASARLGADLLRNAHLRARLSAIADVDSSIRSALAPAASTDALPTTTGRAERPRARVLPIALAAGIALVGGSIALLLASRVTPQTADAPPGPSHTLATGTAKGPVTSAHEADPQPPSSPVTMQPDAPPGLSLVVLSVPLRRPSPVSAAPVPPTLPIDTLAPTLDDANRLADAMRSATEAQRDAAYMAMGRTLRSAMSATTYLDTLDLTEQARVCRLWAEDPSLRPVAFARLAALRQRDPALGAEVHRIALELGQRSDLVPWLRSHGLL